MKNLKQFENYTEKNCQAELEILHWGEGKGNISNTWRLLVKLKSASGGVFHTEGTNLTEEQAKKLIKDFGAIVTERF
jgi:hypothetical protein